MIELSTASPDNGLHKRAFSTLELGASGRSIPTGRTIWIADAHRDNGKRFVVRSDEELTAFLQLESAIRRNLAALGAKTSNRNRPSKGDGSHKVEKLGFARFLWNLVSQSPENDSEKQRGLTFYTWTV